MQDRLKTAFNMGDYINRRVSPELTTAGSSGSFEL